MDNFALDDSLAVTVQGTIGRDAGKSFRINEVPPVEMAGYVLRLLAALRLSDQNDLLALLRPQPPEGQSAAEADLTAVLRLLTGCDPRAVHALITDALAHVQIAPDPKHPTAFRALMPTDVREMATLGQILGAFARTNITAG